MNAFLQSLTKIYKSLLFLYPFAYRDEFAEQMLLDFSDMAKDASKKGMYSLVSFCLRELIDFPVNLLKVHLSKETGTPSFRPEAVRNILRIALAFGLALAINTSAASIVFIDLTHFATVRWFAHLIGWQGANQDIQLFLVSLSSLALGPLLAASIFSMMFPELRPVKKYMPLSMMVFAAPTLLSLIRLIILDHVTSTTASIVLYLGYCILAGMGWGILASFISKEYQKLPIFLFVGVLGYFLVSLAAAFLILTLPHIPPTSFWGGVVSVAIRNMLIGMVIGLLLGIVLEFRRRNNPTQVSV